MGWGLPTTVEVDGQTFAIRSDYGGWLLVL